MTFAYAVSTTTADSQGTVPIAECICILERGFLRSQKTHSNS